MERNCARYARRARSRPSISASDAAQFDPRVVDDALAFRPRLPANELRFAIGLLADFGP